MAVPNMPLPENLVVGQTPHETFHNEVNEAVNYLGNTAQAASTFFAAPVAGGAGDFRAIVAADIAAALALTVSQIAITLTAATTPISAIGDGQAVNFSQRSQSNTATNSGNSLFLRSRGSFASPSAVQDADRLAGFTAQGYDGNSFENAVRLLFRADATISDGVVPGEVTLEIARADTGALLNLLQITAPNAAGALNFVGTVQTDVLRIDQTPVAETPVATHTATINMNGTVYRFLCLV